jgi:hypothetical protein
VLPVDLMCPVFLLRVIPSPREVAAQADAP